MPSEILERLERIEKQNKTLLSELEYLCERVEKLRGMTQEMKGYSSGYRPRYK